MCRSQQGCNLRWYFQLDGSRGTLDMHQRHIQYGTSLSKLFIYTNTISRKSVLQNGQHAWATLRTKCFASYVLLSRATRKKTQTKTKKLAFPRNASSRFVRKCTILRKLWQTNR